MKQRTTLSALAAILLSASLFGQETGDLRESLTFGVKGGVNLSNVYDSEGEDFEADAKTGFAGGIFVAIPITKVFGLQPELLVSQRGFSASGRLLGSDYTFTRTTNFLDLPLMVAIKPSEFLTIVAGPQYSYLLSQKDVFTNGGATFEQEQEFDNDDVRRNMLCFTGGVDFTLDHFVIGARAGWDVRSNNENGSSSTPRYKNVWYQLTIGARF